jgi:hypothetical protein
MPPRSTPRVREHVEHLRGAGFDTQKFFEALIAIRDDTLLSQSHRQALYRLIAMESFIWYLEALRNEPIDRRKLVEEVQSAVAEYDAAIRQQNPGEKAAALVESKQDLAPEAGPPPVEPPISEPPLQKPLPKPSGAPTGPTIKAGALAQQPSKAHTLPAKASRPIISTPNVDPKKKA